MPEILRSLRLGLINLLGITVPGLLLLILVLVGLAPFNLLFQSQCFLTGSVQRPDTIAFWPPLAEATLWPLLSLMLIFAYVIGYIFRLITPDDLDRISGEHVLKRMCGVRDLRPLRFKRALAWMARKPPPARSRLTRLLAPLGSDRFLAWLRRKRILARLHKAHPYSRIVHPKLGIRGDAWPYRGAKGDVYPYHYFREYLKRRGHTELLGLVQWGAHGAGMHFRSKTHVNKMKVETLVRSGDLSAVIESNEAHIRMLSGVWRAVKLSLPIQYLGLVVCIVGFYLVARGRSAGVPVAYTTANLHLSLVLVVLIVGCLWARNIIEHLFHYRRVRELMDIVVCRSLADEAAAKAASQKLAETAGPQAGQGNAPGAAAPDAPHSPS